MLSFTFFLRGVVNQDQTENLAPASQALVVLSSISDFPLTYFLFICKFYSLISHGVYQTKKQINNKKKYRTSPSVKVLVSVSVKQRMRFMYICHRGCTAGRFLGRVKEPI